MSEQVLVLIKPDGVKRGLIGEVIGRFEKKGLKIKAMKMLHLTLAQARDRVRQSLAASFRDHRTRRSSCRRACSRRA